MSMREGHCVNVYIALHPCTSDSSGEIMSSMCLANDKTLEEGSGKMAQLSRMPCLMLPSSIQLQGSGTHILFHNGCVDHRSIVTTLGGAAWDELCRRGTFWFLSCLPPQLPEEGGSRVFGELGSVEASLLACLTGRVLEVAVSPLRVSVIQWMEGGGDGSHEAGAGEPLWRRSNQSEGEFTDVHTLMEFVKGSLTEREEKTATFGFHLVNITFFDPESARTCEIVMAGVSASFEALSTSTSRSLVAVRAWFANVAFASMERSRYPRHCNYFLELEAWASKIIPEEIARFLFPRLFHPKREGEEEEEEEEGDGHPDLQPTQVVYAVLEVDEKALLRGERGLLADDGASAPFLRYLSFWCSLGSLVLEDGVEDGGGSADTHDDGAENGTHGRNHSVDTGRLSQVNLADAKERMQMFLIDPLIFSRLTEGWGGGEVGGETVFSRRRLLAALEQSHHVAHWARQKGLQRRVRRLFSSAIHPSTPVSDVLGFFGAESEAVMWCQRLEWQYYTMLGDFFEAGESPSGNIVAPKRQQKYEASIPSPERAETLDSKLELTPLFHEGSHKEAEGAPRDDVRVKLCIFSSACDSLGSSRTHVSSSGLVPQPMLPPPRDLLQRLSEAEVVRRLLIKLRAAESMESILSFVACQLQRSHVQDSNSRNAWLHTSGDAEGARREVSIVHRCEAHVYLVFLRECARGIEDNFLSPLIETVEEKVGWFMEAAAAVQTQGSSLGRIPFSSPTIVDAVAQTIVSPNKQPSKILDGNLSGWEPPIPVSNEASRQHVLVEVPPTNESAYALEGDGYSLQRRRSEDGDTTNMDGNTVNAPDPQTVNYAATESHGDGRIILRDDSQVPMPGSEGVPSSLVDCGCSKEEVHSDMSGRHLHRLRRVNARGPAHNLVYRRLLATGCVKNVVNHQSESNRPLPALSFSGIMEERARWCESEDLDEYRKLLAYGIYVVGAAGCGKSSFIRSLLQETSLAASSPAVEPHTMRIWRTSTIVEVLFPKAPLPLGGHGEITPPNVRRWMSDVEEDNVVPSRVGVNFVEVPSPFLLAASTGHGKLPSRGVVYYILYRVQDNWKSMQEAIWQHVLTLQYAVAMPDSHVVNGLRSDTDSAENPQSGLLHLPVVLVGTCADATLGLDSAERPAAGQHELDQLRLWFEERVQQQKERAEGQLPRPVLVDSCLTDASKALVISESSSNSRAFQTLLHRTLRFLHHTAPLSPLHILARWLPRRFCAPLQSQADGVDERGVTDFNAENMCLAMSGTLEEFWESHRRGGACTVSTQQEGEKEGGETHQTSLFFPVSPQTLRCWWSCSSEGLLVLFTALQRLREFVSSCFDEQSLDNAVLYHLGFVRPDDPDEIDTDDEKERCLRERDVFLEALLEECRLRGVLLFLPYTPPHPLEEIGCGNDPRPVNKPQFSSGTLNQPLRMVLLGPEWVENIWSQTLAPQMVVYHTMSLLGHSDSVPDDVLSTIFCHSERQLGVAFTAAHFEAVWSRLCPALSKTPVETETDNIDGISTYLCQYLTQGSVSLALLQFLWRAPYNILATNEMSAVMALMTSGLARREAGEKNEEPRGDRSGLLQLHLPCAVLAPNSLLYASGHEF